MDVSKFEPVEIEVAYPRGLIFGPQVVHSAAYGVSFMLPRGWMAGSVLDEVYGIEPLLDSSGRIYLTARIAELSQVMRSHAAALDMGFVRLLPVSIPFVDENRVSIHGCIQGVGRHKHAYVTTVVTASRKAITFAALFDESAGQMFQGVVSELADSVKDITASYSVG